MIIKMLIIGTLVYILYRMVMPPAINAPKRNSHLRKEPKNQPEEDDGEYIDYEEVD